jgi:hypothetical protein
MRETVRSPWSFVALTATLVGLLAWPTAVRAQTVTGQARAVQATVLDLLGARTTVLSDTGTLSSSSDDRGASQLTGNIPSLLTGEALHATTFGWPDQVASEASLANLALTVAGNTIGADFAMARAVSASGAVGVGSVNIDGLSINGLLIFVTGDPNQTISIPGGLIVINEQHTSPTETVVNALHVVVYGVADVVIASATAGVQ